VSRIIQLLFWAVLANVAIWLLRRKLPRAPGGKRAASRVTPPAAPIQLYRDPICGTHVSPEISFTLEHAGGKKHFCSVECRDRFQQSQRQTASA
jgi:YHS domain-containing protein